MSTLTQPSWVDPTQGNEANIEVLASGIIVVIPNEIFGFVFIRSSTGPSDFAATCSRGTDPGVSLNLDYQELEKALSEKNAYFHDQELGIGKLARWQHRLCFQPVDPQVAEDATESWQFDASDADMKNYWTGQAKKCA